MTILTEPKNTNRLPLLERVDVASRVPPFDPGGWYSVLYGQFPAADLQLADPGEHRLIGQIIRAARKQSLKFILIDLNVHPWLAHEPEELSNLLADAEANGLRLVPFGATTEACESREAAIEACLAEWEEQLLERFWW